MRDAMETTVASLTLCWSCWSSLFQIDVLVIGSLGLRSVDLKTWKWLLRSPPISLLVIYFPPNLEDGEKWIPSDIYHEIVYGGFEPKALADNTNVEGAIEVETFDRGGDGSLMEQCSLWPVPRYGEELKSVAGSSGGTGVFLPQTPFLESTESKGTGVFLQNFASNGLVSGRKSKKSGKNGKVFAAAKKGNPGTKDKEVSQVPAEIRLPAEWTY